MMVRFLLMVVGWALGWFWVANAFVPFAPLVSFTQRTRNLNTAKLNRLEAASSDNDVDLSNNPASALLSRLPSFDSLPNPFSNLDPNPPLALPSSLSGEWEATPQGLIQRAKLLLSTDFGIRDPTLLDESFLWIGPTVVKPLSKIDYLAAGRFFDLRNAFPDLDYRAHDFRIDEQDPNTVRITARTVGTLRGELRLRNAILPPNGQRMKCPPESISMTFDPETGKLVKLCSGFCMDRLVGNTAGTCGVMAAATIAGSPPSEFELYPVTTVIERFFGRPVPPLEEATTFLAPFPETVMVQLAKGIIAANMAANDPSLLASSFTYLTPYQGPIAKRQYLESFAVELFADVDPELSHFRVDPYDPYRVWVDVLPLAPEFIGPPQAMSFTFDEEGFCTRITSGAVMDPSLGNGGGLGGPEGYKYAMGTPSPGITTRPLPRLLGRLGKKIVEPLTGIGVDDYALSPDQIVRYEIEYDDDTDEDPASAFVSTTVRQSQLKLEAAKDALQSRSAEIAAATIERAEKKRKELEEAQQAQAALAEKRQREYERIQQEKKAKLEQQRKEAEEAKRQKAEAVAKEQEKRRKLSEDAKKKAEEQKKLQAEKLKKQQTATTAAAKRPPPPSKKITQAGSATTKQPSSPSLDIFGLLGGISPASTTKGSPAPKQDQRKNAEAAKAAKAKLEAAAKLQRQQEEERRAALAKAAAERAEQLRKQQLSAQQKREAEAKARAELAAEQQRKQREEQERRLAAAAATKSKLLAEQERIKRLEAEKQEAARLKRQQQEEAALRAQEAKAAADRAAEQLRKQKEEQKQKAAAEARARAELAAEQQRKQQEAQQRKLAEAAKAKAKLAEEQERKRREEEKKAREAEAKAAAERAAEERRKKEEENQLRAAEAKAAAIRAAEEKKRQEEAKKVELARAEKERSLLRERQQVAEARKTAADQKRRQAEAKRAAEELTKRAAADQKLKLANDVKRLKVTTQAPRGVPTLISWKQRSDGGITGKIYGSPNFADGERIETSPIVLGAVESGSVVTTGSGSRYFLSADSNLTVVNKLAALKDVASAKPGSTIALTKAQRDRNAKEAEEALKNAKPRSTISLFGLGGFGGGSAADDYSNERASTLAAKKTAPRGVPTISKWRKNTDGSVTGFISGAPKFSEGERVTTSPIVSGNVSAGEVVTTGSGSRYFLS